MNLHRKLLISSALTLVLLITLLAGLKPKGYRFCNDVNWMQNNNGINIGPIGIAYSRDSLEWTDQNSIESGITVEMAVKANRFQFNGISDILSFWDGTSPEPFMVGQWQNHLIIRVRDSTWKQGYQELGVGSKRCFRSC